MIEEYKSRHPIAWAVIAGVALFSAAGVAAMKGWLPGTSDATLQACSECGIIESVRTVETPIFADETMAPAEAGATSADAAATGSEMEPVAQVSYSYETTVRYENGSTGVFSHAEPPTWQAGDKVKVVDGTIQVSG